MRQNGKIVTTRFATTLPNRPLPSGRPLLAAVVVFVAACALAADKAHAIVIASDNFESYADGATVIGGGGGSGWTQSWIGNTTTGAPIAIASPGKIANYGKSLELGATSDNRAIGVRQFPEQTGDVYVGVVLQTTNGWDGDFWQLYLNKDYSSSDTANASFSAGLLNDTGLNRYFGRKGSATAGVGTTVNSTVSHTSVNNDVHRFVVKFSKSTGVATDLYDQVTLWVDQADDLATPTAHVSSASVGNAGLNSATLSALHFRVSSLESTDRVYLDNLRIATTYAEAIELDTSVGLQGDFNLDGAVNAADYVVWRKNPGGTLTPADYGKWRSNFGAGPPPPPPPPPEPPPHGTVLYSETFSGATVPTNWFAQNGSQGQALIEIADDSSGIGGGNALSVNAFSRQGVIGTFNDVSLTNVGDQIQLRFDVRLTSVPNNAGGFRFGLYNDNGPALSSGYRTFVGTGTSAPRTDVQADGGDDIDGDILFGTNREIPPGSSYNLQGINDNNPHSFILALKRTASGVLIDVFQDGATNLSASVEHIQGMGTGVPTPIQTVFNQIAFSTNGGILGFIDNVSIEFLAGGMGSSLTGLETVPEPAMGVLLTVCLAGLSVRRCRLG
jgi:hypothetical protein